MPKGGHNRKPTNLKVLEGNPGKRPLPKNEPKPAPIAPKCPSWLPAAGKRLWKQLAPKLSALGLFTEVDGAAFAAMCLHWALLTEAAVDLKRRGAVVDSAREDGAMVKNPSLQVLRDNSSAFAQYAARFGLTPQDRCRISVPGAETDDDGMDALLSGVKGDAVRRR